MASARTEHILILAKTYPSPSAKYVETSCVAGINQLGEMRRLYPIPFRMIEETHQFRKWQWIDARVEKANNDHRPESHKLYIDTIDCGPVIDTKNQWGSRREWLDKVPAFDSLDAIEAARQSTGLSMAMLLPKRMLGLEIAKARDEDWTADEREKLTRQQTQGGLFSSAEAARQVTRLRKVPFDFYYRYACDAQNGEKVERSKIIDWEAGALFWNCRRRYGQDWETPFRSMFEGRLLDRNLMLFMGNQHRFQDQWMIISLIYPPRRTTVEVLQPSLF